MSKDLKITINVGGLFAGLCMVTALYGLVVGELGFIRQTAQWMIGS